MVMRGDDGRQEVTAKKLQQQWDACMSRFLRLPVHVSTETHVSFRSHPPLPLSRETVLLRSSVMAVANRFSRGCLGALALNEGVRERSSGNGEESWRSA